MATSHDRLFKELLRTFLWEFMELFVPQLVGYLDRPSLVFLEPEIFTDVTAGASHRVDLVARMRFRGQETCLLVHVESQAQHQADFAARMFSYFARLHESYGLPVYPIALLSDRAVKKERASNRYTVAAPHARVLDFRFQVIELKRLQWRLFLGRENPVASALMSRMRIARDERAQVKSACLRMLAGLNLDEARRRLLSGFIDTYLRLNEKETKQFMGELDLLEAVEREAVIELTTSWKEEGLREGLREGRREGRDEALIEGRAALQDSVLGVLHDRFGTTDSQVELALREVTDLERLKTLVRRAATVPTAEVFLQEL